MPTPPAYESEYPFESHFMDLDGLKYHYVDEGRGEVLLLVHGNPTWSFAFRHLIRDLSADFRVIAVDHIGCGLSDKPSDYPYRLARHTDNLLRLIESLQLERITLFGHDWGGAIGMSAAVRAPERFARFVLANTAAFRSRRLPLRIAVCRIPLVGALAVRGLNLFVRASFGMAVAKSGRWTAAARAGYLAPYDSWAHRVAIHRFVQDIPLRSSHPSYPDLLALEQGLEQFRDHPVLLVWGERDWCFTPVFLAEFQQRFPDAQTLSLPDAGHFVFEDAPEELVDRVRQFLGRHAEADT